MLFRPAIESDLDRVLSFGSNDPLRWPDVDRHRAGIADGSWSLSNTWLALDGDTLVAMARFWSPSENDAPAAMDGLYTDATLPDRTAVAAELLTHAHTGLGDKPEYHMFLSPGWRDDTAVAEAVAWRVEALAKVGMTAEIERLRYRWTPDADVPLPDPRLEFRPADDATFLDAFRKVSEASLDVSTQRGIATHGVDAEARDHMNVYLEMPGDRSWWRLAYTTDGSLAGLAIPSANNGGPVVGYLGILPEHRGKGLVDPLLGEITRTLAETGATTITADTDTVNIPMAKAFERAGYANFANRLVISAA